MTDTPNIRQRIGHALETWCLSPHGRRPRVIQLSPPEMERYLASAGKAWLSDTGPTRFAFPMPGDPSFEVPVEPDATLALGGRLEFEDGGSEDF